MSVDGNDVRRRRLFRLAALLLVPALVAALELYLQVRHAMKPAARGQAYWTLSDPYLGYRLRPSFQPPDGRAWINAEGFRGDERHVTGAPGHPRVLLLGNSCVFGSGCLDTEIFPVLLEENLRKAGLESAVVLNAGVGGYNSNQVRAYLERELWNFRPTDIIVYVGWNDLVTATWPFFVPGLQLGPKLSPRPQDWMSQSFRLLESSKLFWSTRVRARALQLALRPDRGVDTWNVLAVDNFRANVTAIAEAARQRGVRLFFCRLPYDPARAPRYYAQDAFSYTLEGYGRMYASFDDEIRRAAAGHALIDLPAAIRGQETDMDVIYDYNHLGPKGHRLVADSMAEAFLR